ncbi:MAG: deaminase [Candidatus Micrarchaeia archaeon]
MGVIIGLTGENCAGKGTVAAYLAKKSFYYYSLSDVIREELAREGKEITRENLIKKGSELRRKYGESILAEKIAMRLEPGKNYVIDSIRHPREAAVFKKMKGFVLVHVTAPPEVRFERMRARSREGDPKTLEAFLRLEEQEAKSREGSGQQLLKTIRMADKKIDNSSTLEHLYDAVDALLAGVSAEFKLARPSWDAYFMNIAKVVASRSNCIKRHVASVIVKDKRIISTGYNGTPRGLKNCNEGGCPRCNAFADAGSRLEECLCSHGEENAIVQAAYHGISVKGATLYTTYSPCLLCAKMVINAGISEVVYNADYPLAETASGMFKEAGVTLRQYKFEEK